MTADNIIIDLDGTLCDSGWRTHHAQNNEWDKFHRKSSRDMPFEDVKELVNMCAASGMWTIALTGRSSEYRNITMNWFLDHNIKMAGLLMRPEGDYRSDTVIKPELLGNYFGSITRATERVICILEDRDKMVKHWRGLGFRCWQVQEGEY